MKLFCIVKSTLFLGTLCVFLLASVAGLTVHATSLAGKLATTVAALATAKKVHRLDKAAAVSKAKAKEKAKARIRRWVIASSATIPFAGMFVAPTISGYFEVKDFNEWKKDNPEKEFGEYACESGSVSAELIDESLQGLPENIRPDADRIRSWMPECGVSIEEQPWEIIDAPPSIWDKLGDRIPSPEDFVDLIPSINWEKLIPDVMQDLIFKLFEKSEVN